MASLSAHAMEIAIPICAVIGIVFSLALWHLGSRNSDNRNNGVQGSTTEQRAIEARWDEIKKDISEGVNAFLFMKYPYVGVFIFASMILIFLFPSLVESISTQSWPCMFDPSNMCKPELATAFSFLLGALTSVMCGSFGNLIYANGMTALEGRNGSLKAASRSGAVMGFLLAATSLLGLYTAIELFKWYHGNDWEGLFEAIAGYGLGASSMALFRRGGGGIYAKAADVCVHLTKTYRPDFPQDRNPAVIPNYIGDIDADIAGMGTDLFGSFTASSCAALAVVSFSSFGIEGDFTAMCYPLLIGSMGIIVCLITTLFMDDFLNIMRVGEIKPALENRLIISTILMTVGIVIVSWIALPSSFTIYHLGWQKVVKNWQLSLSVGVGLWAGLFIGFVTKIYTTDAFRPLQDCVPNNVSVLLVSGSIPIFAAISISLSSSFAATYGIAVAALGMLSTIATRLAIDACGPISDYAKRIANMAAGRALDTAGNTTAAIGKVQGFAVESAALVSIALFSAFVTRAAISSIDVRTPKIIISLAVGTKLPYWFFAMTMKSVGHAGMKMFEEVHKQLQSSDLQMGRKEPEYATCIKKLTDASFMGMILPGAIVMFIPLVVGSFFGVEMLCGVFAGSLQSVVQIAILASNTGEAWKKAKEGKIRAGALEYVRAHCFELCQYAESEGIIGDPLKDTSGPPLNILIQLMAIESLVFARFFATHGGLLFKFF